MAAASNQTAAFTTSVATASVLAAAADTAAAGQALATVAIESAAQGVTEAFAASQASPTCRKACGGTSDLQCARVGV
jgi:hypothetical protein